MKRIYYYIATLLVLASVLAGCKDETFPQTSTSTEDFNIEAFSDGYSLAFDMTLDPLGGEVTTRGENDASTEGYTDKDIQEWENYVDPEEFRVFFFDSQDRFLFESRTRWFAPVKSHDGGNRWRLGIPMFQYLSDNYDPNISGRLDESIDEAYNWEKIIEIMKSEPFKVAVMANRPFDIMLPNLSDLADAEKTVSTWGKNGPFWSPQNSVASYDFPDSEENKAKIKRIFDFHHCQYDPIYENKSTKASNCYDFIMSSDYATLDDGTTKLVPYMGGVSSWFHSKRTRINSNDGNRTYYFYKLPKGQILDQVLNGAFKEEQVEPEPKNQYIPMYGIQQFAPVSTWKKGTTYNLSQQTGSQTGEYDYKSISLLRSVVKLELRIPMYDNDGEEVHVNNQWAEIYANNFMARCEPMDVWTPTNEIWSNNHTVDCEWLYIRKYGLYADYGGSGYDFRKRLSWIYGAWQDSEAAWDFGGYGYSIAEEDPQKQGIKYPRIFNPITQRVTVAFITDCYLPIKVYKNNETTGEKIIDKKQSFHRWIVYCGEKNVNDPNTLSDLTTLGCINFFRIEVRRGNSTSATIYNLPITDYSKSTNPIYAKDGNNYKYLMITGGTYSENNGIKGGSVIQDVSSSYPDEMQRYYNEVQQQNATNTDLHPYPLLRNHHYRLTVSFGDRNDINVEVMDGEKRSVGDIIFK